MSVKELIKITENSNKEKVTSARELYYFLEVKERFSRWIERMLEYGFTEGVDYTPYQMVHPQNGQEVTDYVLTLDTAKEISMIQRTAKGKEAREYFIACEKEKIALMKPMTPAEMHLFQAQMLVQMEKEQAEMKEKIREIDAPSRLFHCPRLRCF